MRCLLAWILLVGMLAAPALSQPLSAAPAQILAVLIDGNPSAGGQIIAVMALNAPATSEVQSATYASLRIGTRRFVFTVARVAGVGTPAGSTLVQLRDGNRSLSEVAQLLVEALSGKTDLVVLTRGPIDTGVVTGIVLLSSGRESVRVAAEGATHATLFRGSRETTVVVDTGTTSPMLVSDDSEGERQCRFCEGMDPAP